MFNKKKQPPIRSLIAQGSLIEGNFQFAEGLRVDGEVVGNIMARADVPSMLVVSETAVVQGELRADHIIISGRVSGLVHAAVLLELQPKARIRGDVHYAALEMHQGAIIDGDLRPIVAEGEKPILVLAANNRAVNS